MVHALGEEESVCQRQELGWYRGIFRPWFNKPGAFLFIQQLEKDSIGHDSKNCRAVFAVYNNQRKVPGK